VATTSPLFPENQVAKFSARVSTAIWHFHCKHFFPVLLFAGNAGDFSDAAGEGRWPQNAADLVGLDLGFSKHFSSPATTRHVGFKFQHPYIKSHTSNNVDKLTQDFETIHILRTIHDGLWFKNPQIQIL